MSQKSDPNKGCQPRNPTDIDVNKVRQRSSSDSVTSTISQQQQPTPRNTSNVTLKSFQVKRIIITKKHLFRIQEHWSLEGLNLQAGALRPT